MKDQFVPYEQALALKELGFDEPCIGNYFHTKELKIYGGDVLRIKNSDMGTVTAALWQQAEEWLRNKRLYCVIMPKMTPSSTVVWYIYEGKLKKNWDNCFDTYEEARLACLVKLIEICKEKKS